MILETVLACLTVILSSVVWWYWKLFKYSSLDQIPGPKPLPFIGNSNLVGTSTTGLLQSFLELQKQYGTFYKLWLGPNLNLMVAKPELVEQICSSSIHISKSDGYDLFKPWLGDSILVTTGAKWKSRRKLITPTFHFKILDQFNIVFNKQVDILIDILSKENLKESIEIHNFLNLCSLDIICETAFGTPINAQSKGNPKYVAAVTSFLEIFTLRFFSSWMGNSFLFKFSKLYPRYKEMLKILHEFTNDVIKRRKMEFELIKANPEDLDLGIKKRAALLDMLLEASQDGKVLSDEDIREEVDTFMFEGHDTSSASTALTLLALADNQEVQEKVYQELVDVLGKDHSSFISSSQINNLPYLDLVVKESLRFYPPVPLIARILEQDCILDGTLVPKGTNISLFLYGMAYNPSTFPEPEKFNPERFLPEHQQSRHNFAFTPFSSGPRNCIGQKFALLELKVTVAKILLKFKLQKDPDFEPQLGMCSVLKSKNGIRLKLSER